MHGTLNAQRVPVLTLSIRLRLAREAAGLSQEELADAVGISRRSISNYEVGLTQPNRPNMLSLALVTGVSLEWLMAGTTSEGQCCQCGQPTMPDLQGQPALGTQNRCTCENTLVEEPCQLHIDTLAEVYHLFDRTGT